MDAMTSDMTSQIATEIDVVALKEMADAGAAYALLDVREGWELATVKFDDSLNVPMQQIPHNLDALPTDTPLVVVCHHGVRSLHVMSFLRQNGFNKATSLRGGIDAWSKQIDPSFPTY